MNVCECPDFMSDNTNFMSENPNFMSEIPNFMSDKICLSSIFVTKKSGKKDSIIVRERKVVTREIVS